MEMDDYEGGLCPGCGGDLAIHNNMPDEVSQTCPHCHRDFSVERWRVAAKRQARQAAEDAKKKKEEEAKDDGSNPSSGEQTRITD